MRLVVGYSSVAQLGFITLGVFSLDRARAELDQAKREGNLARAGELSYGRIPELERKLAEAERKAAEERLAASETWTCTSSRAPAPACGAAAIEFGRVIAPLGRSMKRNIAMARELGLGSPSLASVADRGEPSIRTI